ncbi:MAG: hypothetical protein MI749_06655, partial [Desulfovibrionales bacterium]|nr:hypothetical protein [Desulfovibrionales bacterium]
MIKRFALLVSAFFWLTSSVNAQVIDRIVAIVNNDIITLSELNKLTDPYKRKIEASDQTESQKAELFKNVQKDALERLIDQALTRLISDEQPQREDDGGGRDDALVHCAAPPTARP